ncbi:ATP-binding protein [Rhizobium phaseoli]|uniref:ATP-binding protein n=1 Tax=Rhizobium phaseoli TaxID=396 RepID=UPI000BEA5062|nr:ATP-binding protein [Rhizobium phaseoli]PDS69650.1 histidine kinase [Rhizobium phaseoli]
MPDITARTFATRARTIDHLGREQIADCPTAVSELWKNSWDAYARNVRLRIFSEEAPVAVLTDDGHGMRPQDLFERWLVIGTESKVADIEPVAVLDRQGLPPRPRQGQKGIGRLSSAKLGSILLLISKYRDHGYVAALIDWRMFENPYLSLMDVVVGTGEFATKSEIFAVLPMLADQLASGVAEKNSNWREGQPAVSEPWKRYDMAWIRENPHRPGLAPSQRVLQGLKRLPFRPEHVDDWEGPGTAMLVYDLDDTLKALPPTGDTDLVREEIFTRFQRTLSNFVDPYAVGTRRPEFTYRADIHIAGGESPDKVIVGAEKAIDRMQVQEMEHQLDGVVGEDGVFRGRVKAFGNWVEGKVEFELPKGLSVPERAGSRVGAFELYIASMEFDPKSSTHPRSEHDRYTALAKDYSGLMIYRDDLRVLPYGREDNDFFEIEYKRSKNAGRYFWNHRQMFGRIALTRQFNPNLKDKAGREGFIDNTAAKTFRAIVGNILDLSARRYFGSSSEIRKPRLAEIQAGNRAARAEKEAQKLSERERALFEKELRNAEERLPLLQKEIDQQTQALHVERDGDVSQAARQLSAWRSGLADAAVRPQPSGTARLTGRYQTSKVIADRVSEAISSYEVKFRDAVEKYTAARPAQIVAERVANAIEAVRRQIEAFQADIEKLQREQFAEVRQLAEKRISDFGREAQAAGARFAAPGIGLVEVLNLIARMQTDWTNENREIFGIFVSALESAREQIDLETLASAQTHDLREATSELDRLTSLAQLGIAVEIAAHDLEDFDEMANSGLNALPEDVRNSKAVRDIRLGIEGLTDQLRFLSPLRLSGDKIQRWIDGAEIENFVRQFFAPTLAKGGISFKATDAFRAIRLYERPARVFPVFLNLVNNSIYWVGTVSRASREILLDVIGDEVVIADSGPGVSAEDADHIFKLFFTRKQRSGRGVGLYLARANLAAGGHTIRYRGTDDRPPLPGAAFFIAFKDAELGPRDDK